MNPSPCPTRTAGNLTQTVLTALHSFRVTPKACSSEKGWEGGGISNQHSITVFTDILIFEAFQGSLKQAALALLLCAENRGICSVGKDAQFPPQESHIAIVLPSSTLPKHYYGVAQVPQDSRAHGYRPTHSHFEPYAFSLHSKMLQSPHPPSQDPLHHFYNELVLLQKTNSIIAFTLTGSLP